MPDYIDDAARRAGYILAKQESKVYIETLERRCAELEDEIKRLEEHVRSLELELEDKDHWY